MLEQSPEKTSAIMVISDPNISKAAAATLKKYVYTFNEHALVQNLLQVLSTFLTTTVCANHQPFIKLVQYFLSLPNVNDLPPIAKLKDVSREELDNRTQDTDQALCGCLLNHAMNDLEFLPDSERADGHALHFKVALDMVHIKGNVTVEPGTNDEQPSYILPPLPIVPELQNIRDDNDTFVVTHSPPYKKANQMTMMTWMISCKMLFALV
ncbi:hypothetical protein CHS0354_038989, partial [Potamilus streckersoni]